MVDHNVTGTFEHCKQCSAEQHHVDSGGYGFDMEGSVPTYIVDRMNNQ